MKPTDARQTEALLYAQLLEWGTRAGLALLLLSFAAYVLSLLTPHVPLEQLPALWNQPVARYLALTQSPQDWDWLALAQRGDYANLLGIALLAGCSLPPLLALIPLFLRQRERAFALICALEVLVLLLAASGLLTSGH